ncbi:pitrilysin family protein [Labrenzia sp. CE80]|uniref:M16 family metallopeptidase n=1 Tax=Labrenzia sp. CE80 TaxID=1788986 RepID=UPI00257026DF|nr:pitrilysin family protein [Labrenzia sp. CE80]
MRTHPRSFHRSQFAPLLLAATLLSLPLPVAAAEPQDSSPLELPSDLQIAPGLSHFTLNNGLEVVVIPDHRAPVVTHMLWYKVGSADEPEGQSGVAHFLEHLMFKGTKNHPNGAFSTMVAEIGGQENAFTSTDYTAFFQRVAKEHLPLMMEMEADRMENLVLTDDVVAPELDVVLEERRMRVDSDPGSKLREALTAITFVNHPYGSPVIGWQSEIEALNKESAISFYNRFYTPNNAVLVIAGDVESANVKKLAEQTYGKVVRRAEPGARVRPAEPPLAGERRISVSDPRVRQETVSMTWIVPSQTTGHGHEAEALDVLAYVLGGGATSRLHKEAVLERKLAINAGSYYQGGALDDGRFGFYGSPREGHTLDEIEAVIQEELENVISNGITAEELARAKRSMIASAIYAQDSQQSLARIFGSALATGQTIKDVQTWPSQLGAVTPEDVQEAARKYLSGKPVVGRLVTPTEDTALSDTAKPEKS